MTEYEIYKSKNNISNMISIKNTTHSFTVIVSDFRFIEIFSHIIIDNNFVQENNKKNN